MAQSGPRFSLHVPGVDEHVTRFTHTERLSEPFTLDVAFASRNDAMSAEERRDATSARRNGEELRRINGIVTCFRRGDSGYRRTCCEVVIRPALRRLSLFQGCHIVQGWNARESITPQCGEAGITDVARAVKVRCGSA